MSKTPPSIFRVQAIGWLRRQTNWVVLQSRSKVLVIGAALVYLLGIVATYLSDLMPLLKERFNLEIWIAMLLAVAYGLYKLKLPSFLRKYPTLQIYKKENGNATEPLKAALQAIANDIQQNKKSVNISIEDFKNSVTAIERRCTDTANGKLISTNIAAGNFANMKILDEKIDDAYGMTRELIADAYSDISRFAIAGCVLVPTVFFAYRGFDRFARLILALTSGENHG